MKTKAEIFTVIFNWVCAVTELPNTKVIKDRQDAPRPLLPYASILVVNAARKEGGEDETRSQVVESVQSFVKTGFRLTDVSINIMGEGANEMVNALRDSLDEPRYIDFFSKEGLAHVEDNGPQDLTELENTSYPERSQILFTFRYVHRKMTPISTIEEVEISGEVAHFENEYIEEFIVEIDEP